MVQQVSACPRVIDMLVERLLLRLRLDQLLGGSPVSRLNAAAAGRAPPRPTRQYRAAQ
jgi:hypothetical protein